MKGQITKHEWLLNHKDLFEQEVYKCLHCPYIKVIDTDGFEYFEHPAEEYAYSEEPPCITSYPEQEAGKSKPGEHESPER